MNRFLLLFILLFAGCAKPTPPRDLVAEDRAIITRDLGGRALVEVVHVPAGPFKLANQNNRYYKVTVKGKVYYVEALLSKWNLATGGLYALGGGGKPDDIYAYRYYERTLGIWHRITR